MAANVVAADTVGAGRAATRTLNRRRADRGRLRAASVILLVPAVLFAVYFVSQNTLPSNYALARMSQANDAIVILSPYVAVCAAWEMVVIRAVWGRSLVRRIPLTVALQRLALVVGSGLLASLACYAYFVGRDLFTRFPGWSFPLLSALSVLAWATVGAALALLVRPIVAIPLSLLLVFLAISLPQGWSPLWARHLTGYLADCCGTSDVLAPSAVHASIATMAVLSAVSVWIIWIRLTHSGRAARKRLVIGVVPVAAVVTVAVVVAAPVSSLGALPVVTRPAGQLVCSARVCLWPEDLSALRSNRAGWRVIERAWRSLGLPVPNTSIGPISGPGVLGITTRTSSTDQTILSMASLFPRAAVGCENNFDDPARNAKLDELSYLVYVSAGGSAAAARSNFLSLSGTVPTQSQARSLWQSVSRC